MCTYTCQSDISLYKELSKRLRFRSTNHISFYIQYQTKASADVPDQSSSSSYFLFQSTEYPKDCQEILRACSNTKNASGVYTIKPAGFPEPFEVYCDNNLGSDGWTVIQRRTNGFINFNRNWDDYKHGFGFLGSEFWLGNEQTAYLTNQKKYQLRMDFTNAVGHSYHVTFDDFRIADEWSQYSIQSLGDEGGNAGPFIEWCPSNTRFANSTCERRCTEPNTCIPSASMESGRCICPDGYMIQERTAYLIVSVDALYKKREVCLIDNRLIHEDDYQCSDDATCQERDGVQRCICNDRFEGDGITCIRKEPRKDCYEIYNTGIHIDGVYTIYPSGWEESGFQVYCEMSTDGGGWTVLQRRRSDSVNFYRVWNAYKDGFESPSGDHWLGNDKIHDLTTQKTYQLKVDLTDSADSQYYALYSRFSIGDEDDKYTLTLGTFSGNAGYNSMGLNSGDPFSTRDRDNDGTDNCNCAQRHQGAWWYPHRYYNDNNNCFKWYGSGYYRHCTYANLNGDFQYSDYRGIFWYKLSGNDCGIAGTKMRIRPVG
ncbi:Ficolin-2 [Apostichopus japonicus]|uniref:Ficolin-2 n=1 Tax=Stichopus japonicus TaxID=307972 RepID=A0A2G8L6T3_STIJA|nr:Ficolin-2 [Apostichopus japonicus]